MGRAGQLLTDIITKGMKLRREDVYILNILKCRPPENRNPLPEEAALPYEEIEAVIQAALKECGDNGVQGSAVTPFLLSRVKDLSGGKSLTANLALLRSNARLAAQIAVAVQQPNQNRMI